MRRLAILAVSILMLAAVPAASARTTDAYDAPTASGLCEAFFGVSAGPEPLSACQWDMRYIDANASSRARATGDGVKVGVIDGGIDFNHPDLDNIDVGLSCSFIFSTTPTADPSEVANGDCSNKAAVQDLQGHGTHVATTIAGALDGTGIVGVAPDATIVGLKACTIIGFCFVDSVAAALRYAGDQHLDVVNLSLFADPYLYYCSNDAGQRAMYQEMKDAAKYAQQRGVVVVAAAGNELHDLGHPVTDEISPDWPPDTAESRRIHNNCRVAPAELPGVVTVSALRREHAGGLLQRRLPDRRHRPGRRRRPDAGHDVRPHPGRLVEHRRDRLVGVLRCHRPSRPRRRRSIRVDQRDVDGVTARRRCRRVDHREPPGLEPGSRGGRSAVHRDADGLPEPSRSEPPPLLWRSWQHDVLRGGHGERPGGSLEVDRSLREPEGRAAGPRRPFSMSGTRQREPSLQAITASLLRRHWEWRRRDEPSWTVVQPASWAHDHAHSSGRRH